MLNLTPVWRKQLLCLELMQMRAVKVHQGKAKLWDAAPKLAAKSTKMLRATFTLHIEMHYVHRWHTAPQTQTTKARFKSLLLCLMSWNFSFWPQVLANCLTIHLHQLPDRSPQTKLEQICIFFIRIPKQCTYNETCQILRDQEWCLPDRWCVLSYSFCIQTHEYVHVTHLSSWHSVPMCANVHLPAS